MNNTPWRRDQVDSPCHLSQRLKFTPRIQFDQQFIDYLAAVKDYEEGMENPRGHSTPGRFGDDSVPTTRISGIRLWYRGEDEQDFLTFLAR